MKSSAGSSGSRRRHESLRRGSRPTRGGIRRPIRGRTVVLMAPAVPYRGGSGHPPTPDATSWQLLKAESMELRPAITAENCCVHWLPTSWNSGMPTYWTPGSPGRLVVPGLSIGAAEIDLSVGSANAAAAFLYCGISYVDLRVPGGIEAHPPGTLDPASLRYWGPVAKEMNFQALSAWLDVCGIASAQDHSHPEAGVLSTGAGAYPFFPFPALSSASSSPAATVAALPMGPLPSLYCERHSLKLDPAASFSPASWMRLT